MEPDPVVVRTHRVVVPTVVALLVLGMVGGVSFLTRSLTSGPGGPLAVAVPSETVIVRIRTPPPPRSMVTQLPPDGSGVEATAAVRPEPAAPSPTTEASPEPVLPRPTITPTPVGPELEVSVSEHQFSLISKDADGRWQEPVPFGDNDFGPLVALPERPAGALASSMLILTGGSDGGVSVEVRASSQPLGSLSSTMSLGWELGEAVSTRLLGPVSVDGWGGASHAEIALPGPPGTYRVQVFTRGRVAAHYDGVMDDTTEREHYLVLIGPESVPHPRERAGSDDASRS